MIGVLGKMKRAILLATLCLLPCLVQARSKIQGFCMQGSVTVTVPGATGPSPKLFNQSLPAATVTIYKAGTTTLSAIYSDNAGTVKANPFTCPTSASGPATVWFAYANDGRYDVKISGTGVTTPFTLGDFSLIDVATYGITPQQYGAIGDNSNDDTAAIQAASTAACTATGVLYFPTPSVAYKVTSTISLCDGHQLFGNRSKINYTGTGSLFTIPFSSRGTINGLEMEGTDVANTWAITCAGTAGNGCLNEHIYENWITHFGDLATGSGGCIRNSADTGRAVITGNFLFCNGTQFYSSAPMDSLYFAQNYMACSGAGVGTGRGFDMSGNTGAVNTTIAYNNNVCRGGAGRLTGTGGYVLIGNEYETTAAVTNANSAAYEFLGNGTGSPIIASSANMVMVSSFATYGYYWDNGVTGPVYSSSVSDRCLMETPANPAQYCIYNGNASATNRWQFSITYVVGANLFFFPNDVGVVKWPMASTNLTDSAGLVRGTLAAGTTTLETTDFIGVPFNVGFVMSRLGAGNGNAKYWGWTSKNAGNTDGSKFFESSSTYTTGGTFGWMPNSGSGLYFPSTLTIGTGVGATPVMNFAAVGNVSLYVLPSYANNAAAVAGGLAVGRLYKTGADPDVVAVVH